MTRPRRRHWVCNQRVRVNHSQLPTGPGSAQEVPPPAGQFPIDPAALPASIRDELQAPDPVAIDTASPELRDGQNHCPKCGATEIHQRAGTDQLVCMFCRHQWEAVRVEEKFGLGEGIGELRGTQMSSGAQDIAADSQSLQTFKCTGCGAEVVVNTATSMTARCHWCRHVFGVNEQINNGAVPDAVLPFLITKDDAVARIRQFVDKRRMFALKAFKQEFKPENVLGVYLPYMVVDANARAAVQGAAEIETARYTRGEGKDQKTYYDADVYRVEREVEFEVDDLTLESSEQRGNLDTKVNTNNIINTILPFDTKNAVKWNASYLVGYTSEKRDRDVAHLHPRLEDQLLSIARAQVHASVGRYNRGVRWEQEHLEVHGTRWVSMYLPVWLYSYQQSNGMLHYIAVNGRTGETMGSVPVQQWKLIVTSLAVGTVVEGLALWMVGR